MWKKLAKAVCFPFLIVYWLVFSLCWLLKKVASLFFRSSQPTVPDLASNEIWPESSFAEEADWASESEEEEQDLPQAEIRAIHRVGSIIPVEEDHDLRTFTVMNPEGEIYELNTAVEGPFFGATWTRILDCYETQQPIRARRIQALYSQNKGKIGYQVKIGEVKAFLPITENIDSGEDRPINVLVIVTQIDPEKQELRVSSKLAYQSQVNQQNPPTVGENCQGISWFYDQNSIYVLLPDEYLGIASRQQQPPPEIEKRMGQIVCCHIESLDESNKSAKVSLQAKQFPQEYSVQKVSQKKLLSELQGEQSHAL